MITADSFFDDLPEVLAADKVTVTAVSEWLALEVDSCGRVNPAHMKDKARSLLAAIDRVRTGK